MILNITEIKDSQLVCPRIALVEQRVRRLAILSFRCELEDKVDKTGIYCIKSNLIIRNDANPEQVLCYLIIKEGEKFIDFCPNQICPFKMSTRTLAGGFFYLHCLETGADLQIVQAALQINIRAPGEN